MKVPSENDGFLSGRWQLKRDTNGAIQLFIDRDSLWFRYILDYLRSGAQTLDTLDLTRYQLQRLLEEARFFGLTKMEILVEKQLCGLPSISTNIINKSVCSLGVRITEQAESDALTCALAFLSTYGFSIVATLPGKDPGPAAGETKSEPEDDYPPALLLESAQNLSGHDKEIIKNEIRSKFTTGRRRGRHSHATVFDYVFSIC